MIAPKRLVRWIGMVRVGCRQTLVRTTRTARGRVRYSVLGVGIAIALLVVVTGIGIGLATGTTVYDDGVDYWIVPEGENERSPLVATDGPQFGSVHETNDRILAYEGVDSATPVLTQVMRMERGDTSEYVLVVGIINDEKLDRVAGVDSDSLEPNDPHYAGGSYDGTWTGEVVLSRSTATLLETTEGDELTIAGNDSFAVAAVDDGSGDSIGEIPVALVQLSELQQLTGATAHDQADQFVVGTTDPAVADDLETIYPQSSVLTRGEMTAAQTFDSDLPLALAVTAFVVALTIGTLFVVTTTGLEVLTDRRQLATMSAIGMSTGSQVGLVGVRTLVTTAVGGVIGAIAGAVGIWGVNALAARTVGVDAVAFFHPILLLYGVGVALLVGLLSLPYLLILTRRVTGGVPT